MDYSKLASRLSAAHTESELHSAIVNAPFEFKVETALMFLGIIVLLVVNKEKGTIDRIALSKTELAENTTTVSVKQFEDIKIPVGYVGNIIARAITSGECQDTTDWKYLFAPALSSKEARLNQASGGIAYSAVYPLLGVGDGAAMIFSYYQYVEEIGDSQHEFMRKYSQLCADALKSLKTS